MTVKRYLEQIARLDELLDSKLESISRLRDRAVNVTASISPDNVQGGGSPTRASDIIDRVVDLERELDRSIDKLVDLKVKVLKEIDNIPNLEYRLILIERYVNLKPFAEIAESLYCSIATVYRKHEYALKAFKKYNKI